MNLETYRNMANVHMFYVLASTFSFDTLRIFLKHFLRELLNKIKHFNTFRHLKTE